MKKMTAEQTRMHRAFALVSPARFPGQSWRDEISTDVTLEALDNHCLTIEDVRAAIVFYTATEAVVARRPGGWIVKADGYRKGPAGP